MKTKNYIDPVVASAENYKLLSQDGNIRVVEMTLKPGEIDEVHSHPFETVYFIRGGTIRILTNTEYSTETNIPDGHVMHHGPWENEIENIGKTTIKAIIFEIIKQPVSEE